MAQNHILWEVVQLRIHLIDDKVAVIFRHQTHGLGNEPENIFDMVEKTEENSIVFYYPPDKRERVVKWLGDKFKLFPQEGADLGEKMGLALEKSYSLGYERSVLIGTDCPGMTPGIIDLAFKGLENKGAVIGPAVDGGFYLIGFKKNSCQLEFFKDIPWGTDSVFELTMKKLEKKQVFPSVLPLINDIDTIEDLKAFVKNSQNKSFPSTHTYRYILKSGLLDYL